MHRKIYHISTQSSRLKGGWKDRVLRTIKRFFCVSGEIIFRTPDSNRLNSSTMFQARTYSTDGKWRVLGLGTVSHSFFLYLEKIYSQKETAPWTCKLQYLLEETYLASAQAKKANIWFDHCKQTEWLATLLTVWSDVTKHPSCDPCDYLYQKKIITFCIPRMMTINKLWCTYWLVKFN